MADPLASIPILVPTPAHSSQQHSSTKPRRDTLEDRFATLFSPPTPRASPSGTPTPPVFVPSELRAVADERPAAPQPRPGHRSRAPSAADSDFGDFVSVPPTEAPLMPSPPRPASASANGSGAVGDDDVWVTRQSFDFFEHFGEAAKEASEKNRRDVLDELLAHEDDPLYFLSTANGNGNHAGKSSSSSAVPSPRIASTPRTGSTPQPTTPTPPPHEAAPAETSLVDRTFGLFDETDPRAVIADAMNTVNAEFSSSPPPIAEDRSQKKTGRQNSSGGSLSFSSRWMPSLLSRTSTTGAAARVPTSASFTPSSSPSTSTLPHLGPEILKSSSPPSLAGTLSRAAASTFGAVVGGVPPPPAQAKDNPFAVHTFVAPSGAPGFAGDHQWNKGFEFDASSVEAKGPTLVGRKQSTTPILTPAMALSLRAHFPALARLPRSWSLLYSLDQHGISLRTLYANADKHKGLALLAVQNAAGTVFGACVGEGIHLKPGAYYGGGESFLWRVESDGSIHVWKWTGRNDYVALCELDSISFGGGDGHYGLFLDDTLFEGSSAQCPTFNNEPLCAPGTPLKGGEARFECVGVELWGVSL